MSDKDISQEDLDKEYQKTLKMTECSIKDIDQALADIKSAQDGIKGLANSLDMPMESFNLLSSKDFDKSDRHNLTERQLQNVKALANHFFEEALKNQDTTQTKPKKKSRTKSVKTSRKGFRI